MFRRLSNYFKRREIGNIDTEINTLSREKSALARHEITQLEERKKQVAAKIIHTEGEIKGRLKKIESELSALRTRLAISPGNAEVSEKMEKLTREQADLRKALKPQMSEQALQNLEVQRKLQGEIRKAEGARMLKTVRPKTKEEPATLTPLDAKIAEYREQRKKEK